MTNGELFENLDLLIKIISNVHDAVCCSEAIEEHILVLLKEAPELNIDADSLVVGIDKFNSHIVRDKLLTSKQKIYLMNQLKDIKPL